MVFKCSEGGIGILFSFLMVLTNGVRGEVRFFAFKMSNGSGYGSSEQEVFGGALKAENDGPTAPCVSMETSKHKL